jgi:hypothetical protein
MSDASRTPLQQLIDYLFDQVEIVGQQGNNKRMRCKNCNHNFSGYAGRVHDHLISKAGAVRGCTFSESNNKQEILDELDILVNALPKTNKRRAIDVANTDYASSSGIREDVQLLPVEGEICAGQGRTGQSCGTEALAWAALHPKTVV